MALSSIDQVRQVESSQGVKLPEPDLRNITVLTRKLPNNPILPWNHYDSPWIEPESHLPESHLAEALPEQAEVPEAKASKAQR